MTVATFDNRLVVSLETLARDRLTPVLAEVDVALGYVERLYNAANEETDQHNEVRQVLRDLKAARRQIEAVEGALDSAVKHGEGDITYYG
jgi:transposase